MTVSQKTPFCPALNRPAVGWPRPMKPPPIFSQSMSRRSGMLSLAQSSSITTTPRVKGKARKLCATFPAALTAVKASGPISGSSKCRPKVRLRPERPSTMKQLATIQWLARSSRLKRVTVRPEGPPAIRMRPRSPRKSASAPMTPRMATAPIQARVVLWKSRQALPCGWIRLAARGSGMETRPSIRPPCSARCNSISAAEMVTPPGPEAGACACAAPPSASASSSARRCRIIRSRPACRRCASPRRRSHSRGAERVPCRCRR